MEYMLLVHADPVAFDAMSASSRREMIAAYEAYAGALEEAGAMRGGGRLRPGHTATTVRVHSGKTQVLNGPYAETREQLGGYFLIDVPDLDAALQWAARCPGASHGAVEVRPVWPPEEYRAPDPA